MSKLSKLFFHFGIDLFIFGKQLYVRPKCILYLKNSECVTVKTSPYIFHNRTTPSTLYWKLHSAHHTLKTIFYNDYIIRNNLYTSLTFNLNPNFAVSVNTTLINTLLDIHND